MDHPDLQDNPRVWWNTGLIAKIVHEHVLKWKIDAVSISPKSSTSRLGRANRIGQIITFDEGGVSGHINHRAVSAAVR